MGSSNLTESYKEISILRCIGLENDKISRIYLWESIIVVLNGGVIGLCTGITVAMAILIQNSLWVELRPKFAFPWSLVWLILTYAVFCSIFVAWLPSKRILKIGISK